MDEMVLVELWFWSKLGGGWKGKRREIIEGA